MAAPQSVAEVEQLVKQLYKPGPATQVKGINDQLLQLQHSQDGWRIADELMASDDMNVRFFAALTFMIKLNNDGLILDDETAQSVQIRLISWLVRLVQRGEGGLVCKKLCSALTAYFIWTPPLWEQPLLHLALSFYQGDVAIASDVKRHSATISELAQYMDGLQLQVLLWFAASLAEEVGRIPTDRPKLAQLHQLMEKVVRDASEVMSVSLTRTHDAAGRKPKLEALQTFLTWINYAQPIWPRNPTALQYLRNLIEPAALCLLDESLQMEALYIFRDILESYTSFFQPQHMSLLAKIIDSDIGPKLLNFITEQDADAVPFAQFLTAFGCANIQSIVEEPSDASESDVVVRLHLLIISAKGYPGDDDQLSLGSIEFWNTYIEYINDTVFSKDDWEPDPAWLQRATMVLEEVVALLWRKLWTPTVQVAKEWTDAESQGFKEFRLDATDLMLSVYVERGKQMLKQLVGLTLQSLDPPAWRGVEAGLFCLNALSDNILEETTGEDIMGEIFRSTLFRDIADFSQYVPSQVRRTAIDMLGSYGQYIEQHAEFLPDTVRFLFASLEMAGLANAAAKSIASLCSACRANLTNELPGFLDQYSRFLESKTSEPYTKEKVIGAIAAIIQALSPESAKAQPLLTLLANIEKDGAAARKYSADGDEEMVEVMGITALECLASIGKGMQVPEDVPINIYDDDEERPGQSNYWESEEGQAVQQRIVGCLSVLEVVGNYSAAIDATCQVLRSGFTETQPGPFVLPASVTVRFLAECSLSTPQLDSVLSTAYVLVTQHSRRDSKRINEEAGAIFATVSGFMQTLGQSSNDPGVAAGCIDILSRLVPYYTHVLLGGLSASTLDFTLSAIEGPENFPKKSASDFWVHFIKPQTAQIPNDVQQGMTQVMAAYGPKLTNSLIRQIGGHAQRSDLEYICEPLKALLLHQSGTQAWLQQSLMDGSFPSTHISMDERAKFLRQILSSRSDGRKIKELSRGFWAQCRGTVVDFRS